MRRSKSLVENIIGIGANAGLTAADIAAKAGLTPGNLSRIRRSGRFSADTMERLLAAVGAEVSVTPRPRTGRRVLPLVTQKLNAGRRERLTQTELRRLLTKFRPSQAAERAFSHLVGLVEELPVEQVHDLVLQGDASLPALNRIADFVEGSGPTVDWIRDQTAAQGDLAQTA